MLLRLNRLIPIRLQAAGGRLLCRVALPSRDAPGGAVGRELVIVASSRSPRLRYLAVFVSRPAAPAAPDAPLPAA